MNYQPLSIVAITTLSFVLGAGETLADSISPSLVDFNVSTISMDTSSGPASLSVHIEAVDDLSGFGSGSTGNGSIDIRHENGSNPFGRGSLPITGGTNLNPIFEFTLTAPQYSPAGTYPISLALIDNVFNTTRLNSNDLAALGFPSQLTIVDVSAVPVPPAFYLFGTGLMGLIGIGKRKRALKIDVAHRFFVNLRKPEGQLIVE